MNPALQNRVYKTLEKNAYFQKEGDLRILFVSDVRLQLWQSRLPEANNTSKRVQSVYAYLLDNWNTDQQNALYLLLHVLYEQEDDIELQGLAKEVYLATLNDKIAERQSELKSLKEKENSYYGNPDYNRGRQAELRRKIRLLEARKDSILASLPATVSPVPIPPPLSPVLEIETYTDLEIHITGQEDADYYTRTVTLDGDSNHRVSTPLHITADQQTTLRALPTLEYGAALFALLFDDANDALYTMAQERARLQTGGRLRWRLQLGTGAADLHALAWECLRYPQAGGSFRIATNAKYPFSRALPQQPGSAPKINGPIRMLCVFANPNDLGQYQLAPLDVSHEIANLRDALAGLHQAGMDITFITGLTPLTPQVSQNLEHAGYGCIQAPASLYQINQALARAPGYHIVHIVGHGTFSPRRSQGAIFLEDEQGNAAVTTDQQFAEQLNDLEHQPHLIFLAVCEGATHNASAQPFIALGPRLAQIGIPAVIAMQEKMSIQSAQRLTAEFYPFLLEHGLVDKALNQARSAALTGNDDWRIPVLFMRLKDGQLFTPSSLQQLKKRGLLELAG